MTTALVEARAHLRLVARPEFGGDAFAAKLEAPDFKSRLGALCLEAAQYLPADLAARVLEGVSSCVVMETSLELDVIRAGGIEHLGIVGRKVVTTAGVDKIVALLNTTDASTATTFKYHGMGTGTGIEATSDTALGTEVETRGTGTQTTGSNSETYKSVGTVTATTARVITEYGIFSASSVGTLLDRFKFAAVNLATSDSIQGTFTLAVSAGG